MPDQARWAAIAATAAAALTSSTLTVSGSDVELPNTIPASELPASVQNASPRKGLFIPQGWGSKYLAALQAGKASLALVGDSVTRGQLASQLDVTNWGGLLAADLRSKWGDGGSGFKGVMDTSQAITAIGSAGEASYYSAAYMPTTGTWSILANTCGAPGATFLQSGAAGSTISYTGRGTTIKIFYNYYTVGSNNGPGTFTYTVDGGAAQTVNFNNAGNAGVTSLTISGLSAGNHTVVITTSSTTLYLSGFSAENGAGAVINNYGRPSGTSAFFANSGSSSQSSYLPGQWSGGLQYPASCVIVSLGLNDAYAGIGNGVAPDTWMTNIASYLYGVDTSKTDVAFLMPHAGLWNNTGTYHSYCQRARGLSEAFGAALLDLWTVWDNSDSEFAALGGFGNDSVIGGSGTDPVHPGDVGHNLYYLGSGSASYTGSMPRAGIKQIFQAAGIL